MARWTASAKWAEGPALDGRRAALLAFRLSEWLGCILVVSLELRPRTTLELELAMAPEIWFGLNVAGRQAARAVLAILQHHTGCADRTDRPTERLTETMRCIGRWRSGDDETLWP